MEKLRVRAEGSGYNCCMNSRFLLAPFLLMLLVACAPGATSLVLAPTFRVVGSETTLLRLDPDGVGRSEALIHLELEARNPNPLGLTLARLDGDLYLAGQRVAASSFRDGLSLPAGASSRLGLDISVPVSGAPNLLAQLGRLVDGQPVEYRLDAVVGVDVFGTTRSFPSATVARGTVELPGGLRPPTVRFDPGATTVRFSGTSAVIEIGLLVDNPVPIGYMLYAPSLQLTLDGSRVASASMGPVPVTSSSQSRATARFRVGLAEAGGAVSRLGSGVGGVRFGLDGELRLEVPGISTVEAALRDVAGRLD